MGDGGVVISQPVPEGPVAPVVSSAVVPSVEDGPHIMNPIVSDAPLS